MMVDPVFRYNAQHSVRAGLNLVDPGQAKGIEKAQADGRRRAECDFLLTFSPDAAFFLGGYVDDANPSASEQHASRAVV
jgi:hypothetical protein